MNKFFKTLTIVNTAICLAGVLAVAGVTYKFGGVKNLVGGKIIKQINTVTFDGNDAYLNMLTYRLYRDSIPAVEDIDTILVLGNSITKHPVKNEIGWHSDYGMAASSESNDFCHQLQSDLQKRNPQIVVGPKNIAAWEVNPKVSKDSLFGSLLPSADVVIVRLGENVQEETVDNLDKNMDELLTYIEGKSNAKIIVTGMFWPNMKKEGKMRLAAAKHDVPFIALTQCCIDENEALEGGYATDTIGKKYHFNPGFIGTHPNDKGMRAIADRLLPMFK